MSLTKYILQLLESMLSQMSKTTDISTSRLPAQLKHHTREDSLIASYSYQMSTQWCHQRYYSEPRFITQISTSWVEFVWIFWRTSGLQHSKLDQCFSQSRHWCHFPTWMIHLIKKSLISGRLIKKELLRKLRSGLFNMLPSDELALSLNGSNYDWKRCDPNNLEQW